MIVITPASIGNLSSAVYVGPVMRLHKNPDGSESVVRDCRASVRITVELLRFRHSLVVHNLCSRGLMPWSEFCRRAGNAAGRATREQTREQAQD